MSKFLLCESQEVRILDEEVLLETLAEFGYDSSKVEVHESPVKLDGYRGDKREQKAHVVIRRRNVGAMSNDIGFEKRADGSYAAWVSDFDKSRGLGQKIWNKSFFQGYAKNKTVKWAKSKGATFTCNKDQKKMKMMIKL